MHAKWFVDTFLYVIKYKKGKVILVDALSRRYTLISTMEAKTVGFEHVKAMYEADLDFQEVFKEIRKSAYMALYKQEGFLFRDKRLYLH